MGLCHDSRSIYGTSAVVSDDFEILMMKSFIFPFKEYSLSVFSEPDTIQGTKDSRGEKQTLSPAF